MKVLVATKNAHKAEEIAAILGVECLTLNEFEGAPSVKEDADGFAGNAQLKAQGLVRWLQENPDAMDSIDDREELLILADDSGLEVDALEGAPGVHSARFAAVDSAEDGNASDDDNNAKLLRLMADVPDDKRSARFRCVIALIRVNDTKQNVEFFDGACEGRIVRQRMGDGGFGYDPLFVPEGYETSFGQLSGEEKNRISHRAKALGRLHSYLRSR